MLGGLILSTDNKPAAPMDLLLDTPHVTYLYWLVSPSSEEFHRTPTTTVTPHANSVDSARVMLLRWLYRATATSRAPKLAMGNRDLLNRAPLLPKHSEDHRSRQLSHLAPPTKEHISGSIFNFSGCTQPSFRVRNPKKRADLDSSLTKTICTAEERTK